MTTPNKFADCFFRFLVLKFFIPQRKEVSEPMRNRRTQKGQGLVEYALILVLVAIVDFAVLMLLGPVIGNTFSSINNSLSGL
jgi:pilus assembly protein Flp/PilA